jgi:hypothetical protein
MKNIGPKIKSTICSPDCREWVPSNLDNFLKELEGIKNENSKNNSLTLYRGQSNSAWPLDSSFLRNSIVKLFGINDCRIFSEKIRQQIEFHRAITSLFLLKFRTILLPSKEAFDKQNSHNIDSYFELLKHIQQCPEKYKEVDFIEGTFLIDWTYTQDIALYFATFDGDREKRQITKNDGAVWIYDSSSTGKIQMTEKTDNIINLMASSSFMNGTKSLPLIFHPNTQTIQPRALNQTPVYISQMDFRYDLADIWANYEMNNGNKVFLKLQIKESIKQDLAKHLESKGITVEHVYPH